MIRFSRCFIHNPHQEKNYTKQQQQQFCFKISSKSCVYQAAELAHMYVLELDVRKCAQKPKKQQKNYTQSQIHGWQIQRT